MPRKAKPQAVVYAFATDETSNALCMPIRHDVDGVLMDASKGAIRPTTPNDHLLSVYMWSQVIDQLYLALNIQLSKYPGFSPFASDEIDGSSSIGDVRDGAYSHCDVKCSHV